MLDQSLDEHAHLRDVVLASYLRDTDRAMVLVAEVDRARSENVRRIWPFFRDRRIDAYQDLLKRYGK